MTSSYNANTVEVVAPIAGTVIDITDVPDPVLSKKSVGDGFGISAPPGGTVVSPVTGTVIMVAKTLHAVGFKTESGLQFLVHLGIDTVELEGKPFTLTIAKGDEVKAGQNIGTMDVEAIKEGGKDTTTVVTVTNTTKNSITSTSILVQLKPVTKSLWPTSRRNRPCCRLHPPPRS